MSILRVIDVHKSFGRTQVLRGTSLDVGPGEVVGLVGENGSGKSTLLRIICGLLRQDRGTVAVDGRYGYCPQEPLFFDGLSMEENVVYFGAAYGLSRKAALVRGKALMDRLNCGRHDGQPAVLLSGGTRQKLNLILALLHRPELLLLDEPYQGFDYESYLTFWELAAELARQGGSVVVVSHLMHDWHQLSRMYRLEEGQAVDG